MGLVTVNPCSFSHCKIRLLRKTIAYERTFLSPNTLRSYQSMYKKFQTWCEAHARSYLPTSAETIALYLASIGEQVSFSTLDSTLADIKAAHEKTDLTILN